MHYKRSASLEEPIEGYAAGIEHSQDVYIAGGLDAICFNNAHKLQANCAGTNIAY